MATHENTNTEINSQIPKNNFGAKEEEEYDDFLGDFDVATFLVVSQKSIWILAFLVLTSFFAAFLYARYTKPVFESSSILKLELNNQASALGITRGAQDAEFEKISMMSGEVEFLKSRLIYEETAKGLDLSVNYVLYGKVITEEKYTSSPIHIDYKITDPAWYGRKLQVEIHDSTEFSVEYLGANGVANTQLVKSGQLVNFDGIEFSITTTKHFVPQYLNSKMYVVVNAPEAIVAYLMANTKVEMLNPQAQTIKINFHDYSPQKAADIVNAIDSAYLRLTLLSKSKMHQQTIDFLEQSLEQTEQKLDSAEAKLESFLRENKTNDIKENYAKISEKVEEIQVDRGQLKKQLSLLDSLKRIITEKSDVDAFIPSLPTLGNPEITALLKEYNKAVLDRNRMALTQNNKTYALQSQDKLINELQVDLLESINIDRRILLGEINNLNRSILELESGVMGIPEKETEYNRLKRYYDLYEKFYLLLMEKEVEFAIAKAGTIPNFTILDRAFPTQDPIYPKKGLLYGIGVSIGILLSLIFIFIRYFLHDTISNQKELEKVIKAPIVGGIPEYQKEKMEFSRLIVDKSPKSIISESIRSIRTNLEFIVSTRSKKRIISVTSTVSGEGKTFVSTNLAGVIALSNLKVVLLDLDMRKPKVHLAFGMENIRGMSTTLIGKHTWQDCVNKTSIPNLDFISAGPTPPNPSELILREEFNQLIDDLHREYDVVVIDTPPVGLVTDGILIMRKADLAIYVVRANYSKKGVKKHINSVIKMGGFSHLAVVMNAVKSVNTYGYGGYGYGYGYGYGNGYYEIQNDEEGSFLQNIKKRFKKS